MGELQSGSDNERIDEICHLTRVAISETENEDDLQPEILRHLEECEKCRSFREQNKKMLEQQVECLQKKQWKKQDKL